jgi:hypothetical protein
MRSEASRGLSKVLREWCLGGGEGGENPGADFQVITAFLAHALAQLAHEKQRADSLATDLRMAKEQYVAIQMQLEAEEEAITNKLIKRLDVLKREKAEVRGEREGERSRANRFVPAATQPLACMSAWDIPHMPALSCSLNADGG